MNLDKDRFDYQDKYRGRITSTLYAGYFLNRDLFDPNHDQVIGGSRYEERDTPEVRQAIELIQRIINLTESYFNNDPEHHPDPSGRFFGRGGPEVADIFWS